MPDPLQITLNVPVFSEVKQWGDRLALSLAKILEFKDLCHYFFSRGMYDCRVRRDGVRIEGEFIDDLPLRFALSYGTEEDRKKGFLSMPEDSRIKPWAMCNIEMGQQFVVPNKTGFRDRLNAGSDPAEVAWTILMDYLRPEPASHIYIAGGQSPSNPTSVCMFFPVPWGSSTTSYVFVSAGTRYFDARWSLFDGEPTVWAQDPQFQRGPRECEIDAYFASRNPLLPLPVGPEIPMEAFWENSGRVFGPLRSVEMVEYGQACSMIGMLTDIDGNPYVDKL